MSNAKLQPVLDRIDAHFDNSRSMPVYFSAASIAAARYSSLLAGS